MKYASRKSLIDFGLGGQIIQVWSLLGGIYFKNNNENRQICILGNCALDLISVFFPVKIKSARESHFGSFWVFFTDGIFFHAHFFTHILGVSRTLIVIFSRV